MMRRLLLIPALLFGFVFGQALAPPIDFESSTISYTFTDFDGGVATVINNPQSSGINTSSKVGQMVKNAGQVWGGSYLTMTNPINFSTNKIWTMKVWSPRVGARVLLKVEDMNNTANFFEREDTSTVANMWEELTFDFSAINTGNDYHRIVLIWDLGVQGDGTPNFTFYFDDIELGGSGPSLQQIDLPVTFDDTMVDYTVVDFGGNFSQIIPDPNNMSNNVMETTKDSTAQLWAGTTISTANGLASRIPFSDIDTEISVRVWSPDANIPVRLKAEDHTNGTISVETETMTTVANQWETLVFDFSNEVSMTAPLDTANTYDMLSIFFNFGTDGATAGLKTYLFDDVEFVLPPPLQQIDLPITFEDSMVDYTMTDFGGNFSMLVPDPMLSTNTVSMTTKDSTAQLWAGTTISTPMGLANPIPFTDMDTKISVRVLSPDANIPVRLKAEDHTNGTISVETETMTTVANQWETLVFDFANEVAMTPALDTSQTYDLLSIFFNFGTDGATAGLKVYYFDDVEFGVFVGIEAPQLLDLRYYPNPVSDRMVLEAEELMETVAVYDMTGREVLRQRLDAQRAQLDLSSLQTGVYVVKVTSEFSANHFRIIKD